MQNALGNFVDVVPYSMKVVVVVVTTLSPYFYLKSESASASNPS